MKKTKVSTTPILTIRIPTPWFPSFPGLGKDLWRLAWLTKNRDDQARWEKEFKLGADDIRDAKLASDPHQAEIVVLYENGISPAKTPKSTI